MTLPRWIHPGAVVHVTRRTLQRQFLLRPSPENNQVFAYCLLRAAELFNVEIHGVSAQNDHYHIVLTDHDGRLPDFMQWLNRNSAKCLIKLYEGTHPERHLENIWARESYGHTILATEQAVRQALVYILTNPVKDGMVESSAEWPGFASTVADWLDEDGLTVERPEVHFVAEPASVSGRFTAPACLLDRGLDNLTDDLQRSIVDKERHIGEQMRLEGRSFMGAARVLRQDPFDSPKTRKPKGELTPVIAAGGDEETRIAALDALVKFRQRYREARRALCESLRNACNVPHRAQDITFPAGTYLLRRLYDVVCDCADGVRCFLLGRPELRDRPPLPGAA